MPLDLGYVGLATDDGVVIRIYYQTGFTPTGGQTYLDAPVINGPRGWCLDVTNSTGVTRRASVASGAGDLARNVVIPTGDPVTSGGVRSRTAAQLDIAGFSTRGSVAELTVS